MPRTLLLGIFLLSYSSPASCAPRGEIVVVFLLSTDRHVAAAHFRAGCLTFVSQVLFADEKTGIATVILLYRQSCEHVRV
jgi:hypothetical protein